MSTVKSDVLWIVFFCSLLSSLLWFKLYTDIKTINNYNKVKLKWDWFLCFVYSIHEQELMGGVLQNKNKLDDLYIVYFFSSGCKLETGADSSVCNSRTWYWLSK